MSMELSITEITVIATKVILHVGIPKDQVEEVEEALAAESTVDDIMVDGDWDGDEEIAHVVIEVFAFCVVDLVQTTVFQEVLQSMQPNQDGNVLQISDTEDWSSKVLELPSTALTA